jgi:hypothetical protein
VCCEAATECGGGCTAWSFDSGSNEGWVADTDSGFPVNGGGATNGVTNVTTSTTTFHDGTRALAVPALANGQVVSVAVPVCRAGSTLNLAGFTLSAWVRLSGTALSQIHRQRDAHGSLSLGAHVLYTQARLGVSKQESTDGTDHAKN